MAAHAAEGFQITPSDGTACGGTAVVVLLTSLIYEYLIPGGRNPCFALIGAVYGVGSRFEEGFHNGINRLIGTFVGGILVIPFYMLYQKQPFGIPAFLWLAAGLCLVLWCNLALQADSAIQPGIVVYFVVLYTVGEERVVFYTLARILDTGIGVLFPFSAIFYCHRNMIKNRGSRSGPCGRRQNMRFSLIRIKTVCSARMNRKTLE